MVKRNFMAYLDSELIELARNEGINISQEFNEYLKMRVSASVLEENKPEKLRTHIRELKNKLLIAQKELEVTENIQIKTKDEKLKKEMEEAMK